TYIIGASLSVALGISSSLISFYYTVQKPTPSLGLNIETFIRSANENELTQKKLEENRKFIIQANDIANSIKSDLNDPQVINSLKLSEIND
ncbi:hypothetical protein, partial [Klebsiella pneumoniae]|uniref:hypothetical protein n=1 Tax=Klebsiella pneumoniae TaxID=573 RepID=UPI003B5BBACE